MLDHALGRPSPGWQRTQVLATVLGLLLWSRRRPPSRLASLIAFLTAVRRGPRHGGGVQRPPLAVQAAWTVVLRTLAAMHALRHFALLTWMNEPESRARMYTRHYFRVTYLFNALDAGFLTAMHLRPAVLRDLASFLLTGFYLCCPVMAEHKIHAYRHSPTVQMLRVSLNKAAHPVLRFLTRAHRPRLGIRRNIVLPRPAPAPAETSFPGAQPLPAIPARLYYAGTPAELARCREVILQCPGGGFVAMNPTCHDDWTSTLAQRTGRPIVGLDYGKAPQYPFPWAIEECFDAYRTLLATRGACIGLRLPRGETLRVILLGDSAGGNLAVTTCYKAMLAADPVPMPQALLLIYPSLSFEMNCWLSPDEIALISSESAHQSGLFDLEHAKHRRREYAPLSEPPAPRGYDVKADRADTRTSWSTRWLPRCFARFRSDVRKGPDIPAALSMSSKFSYFRDRVLTPEMLRAFALLYLTKSPIPIDLEKDFLISPVLAPDALLAELPPVYMICGERDPLIDDTVLFAGRYRVVHEEAIRQRRTRERSRSVPNMSRLHALHTATAAAGDDASGGDASDVSTANSTPSRHLHSPGPSLDDEMARRLHVKILPGISHGFLNMLGLLPETAQILDVMAGWVGAVFDDAAAAADVQMAPRTLSPAAAARRRQALLRAVERHRARSPKSSPVPRTEAAPPDAAAHRPSWSTAGLPVDRRHTALAGGSPRRDPDLEPVLPMPQHAAARGGLPLAQPHPLPAYDPSPPGAAAGSDDESDFPLGDVALPTLPVGSASLGDDDGDGDAETDRADAPGRRLSLADAPMPLLPLRTRSDVTGAARMDVSPWHPRAAAPDSPLGSALGGAAHSLADALHLDMASLLRESPPPRLHLHADLASDPLYAGLELATPFVPTPPLEAMASATGRIASWPGPWASDDMLAGRAAAVDVPFAPASAAVTGGGSLSAHVLPRLSVGTVPLTRFDGSPLPYRRLLHPSASAGASGILLSARSSHAGLRSGGGVQAAVAGLTEVASSDVLGRRQQDLAQHLHDLSP